MGKIQKIRWIKHAHSFNISIHVHYSIELLYFILIIKRLLFMEMVFFQFWVIKGNVYIDGPTIIIMCLWRDISLAIVDVNFYFLRKVLAQFWYAYINIAVTIYDYSRITNIFIYHTCLGHCEVLSATCTLSKWH